MKRLIIFILLSLNIQSIKAHNPAVATFHLTKGEIYWQLRAEFAWSLRNALYQSFPFLTDQKLDEDIYSDCVKDYLNINFRLKLDETPLVIHSIKQIPGDHGHSFVFISELTGPLEGSLMQLSNKCMTELYRKQRNIVLIKTTQNRFERICTKKMPSYSFNIS